MQPSTWTWLEGNITLNDLTLVGLTLPDTPEPLIVLGTHAVFLSLLTFSTPRFHYQRTWPARHLLLWIPQSAEDTNPTLTSIQS